MRCSRYAAKIAIAALACLLAAPAGYVSAADKTVKIFFWYDYVPKPVLEAFEKETGIKVVYDSFEATEMLTTKVLTGRSGYDIVMPTAQVIAQYIRAGVLQKLALEKIPNAKGLNPDTMALLAQQDPGNAYGLPYAYGTTGIAYNAAKVTKRMPDAPVNSLDMIFKPEIAAKFKDCGIAIVDSPEGVMAVALNYLGFKPYTTDETEIKKAGELLASIRPFVRHFRTGAIMNELSNGEICLALAWSGDTIIAAGQAKEAKNGVEVRYSIPKEGTEIFFDTMAILADAKNVDEAHQLINFLLKPENMATFTNALTYPNAVIAATELVDENIRNNPNIYPAKETMQTLFLAEPRDQKSLRTITRTWSAFKSGRKVKN